MQIRASYSTSWDALFDATWVMPNTDACTSCGRPILSWPGAPPYGLACWSDFFFLIDPDQCPP